MKSEQWKIGAVSPHILCRCRTPRMGAAMDERAQDQGRADRDRPPWLLTKEPNAIVAPIHQKAMPVILDSREEIEAWLSARWEVASRLQRPLADDRIILLPAAEPLTLASVWNKTPLFFRDAVTEREHEAWRAAAKSNEDDQSAMSIEGNSSDISMTS
ncbi:hypothetical protein NXC12_PE00168 (plasmid) [Rhizobium etli]|uniref:SOS response associated peptidase (SRAP) n=1 Tax=Rhizobium etli TaxID=29449 RepID=A0AAN1ENJ2_RHIET|nr:hypothetical protein [Rhizobium etli]ARQ13768.1 hypothetical protein NXC12_PE00168 [Rhizobium etli]